MLEVGTKAPDFSLPDQNGKVHSLKDYLGKKVILLPELLARKTRNFPRNLPSQGQNMPSISG